MKNKTYSNSPSTSVLNPSKPYEMVYVSKFEGLKFQSASPKLTILETFRFMKDGKRIYVLLNGCTAKHAEEWIRKWQTSRNARRHISCGKNAVIDDLEVKSEEWYRIDYHTEFDGIHRTRRTMDYYGRDPEDEMSLSDFAERERTTAYVYDRYFDTVESDDCEYDELD